MSAPMKELEADRFRGLAHGDNPVLTWMAYNMVAMRDAAGNVKPDKRTPGEDRRPGGDDHGAGQGDAARPGCGTRCMHLVTTSGMSGSCEVLGDQRRRAVGVLVAFVFC